MKVELLLGGRALGREKGREKGGRKTAKINFL